MEEVSRGPDYSIYRVKVQVHQVPDTDQYWCEVRAGPQVTPYPEDRLQGGPCPGEPGAFPCGVSHRPNPQESGPSLLPTSLPGGQRHRLPISVGRAEASITAVFAFSDSFKIVDLPDATHPGEKAALRPCRPSPSRTHPHTGFGEGGLSKTLYCTHVSAAGHLTDNSKPW